MKTIFTENQALFLLFYLLSTMSIGIFVISMLNNSKAFSKLQVRKMFHILAFLLFVPSVYINVSSFMFNLYVTIVAAYGIRIQLLLGGHALR